MSFRLAAADTPSVPIYLIETDAVAEWTQSASARAKAWVGAHRFTGKLGQTLAVPGEHGEIDAVLFGYGDEAARARSRFHLGHLPKSLPAGTYHLESDRPTPEIAEAGLGWLLGIYRFDRYRKAAKSRDVAMLCAPAGVDAARIETVAQGEALTRDLINTPAEDMGPDGLEAEVRTLADHFQATVEVIEGADLVERNFPMIHTVGRAAARAPRLLDLRWGSGGPSLTLVGKGVCFDTGGLNLKPGASMGLMKKDMGGAATVIGLAHMIMALKIPLRLRVLIPAVENAVAGAAFRPGDILRSRKGLTVEVNNTDAEGRLVLADALAYAVEEAPDLLVSMATLTGAARVAVGPDLAPFYTDDETVAATLGAAGQTAADPVWRMPFWAPYEAMIEPQIADLDNAPKGGFAGSVTAALFLRRFVDATRYVHFDIYGWQPTAAPGRPKGGVGQGARALLEALPRLLPL